MQGKILLLFAVMKLLKLCTPLRQGNLVVTVSCSSYYLVQNKYWTIASLMVTEEKEIKYKFLTE